MKKILVIGGGAMGSAFTIPCLENNNKVIITEPYSKRFIKDLASKDKFHSALKVKLSKKLKFRKFSKDLLKEKFDLIVYRKYCFENSFQTLLNFCKTKEFFRQASNFEGKNINN